MILYNRKKVKYRKDGYCWKKRKDGKTTREDHMKLKVQGVEVRSIVGVAVGCAGLGGDSSPTHLNPTKAVHTFRKTLLFAEFHLLPLAWVSVAGWG